MNNQEGLRIPEDLPRRFEINDHAKGIYSVVPTLVAKRDVFSPEVQDDIDELQSLLPGKPLKMTISTRLLGEILTINTQELDPVRVSVFDAIRQDTTLTVMNFNTLGHTLPRYVQREMMDMFDEMIREHLQPKIETAQNQIPIMKWLTDNIPQTMLSGNSEEAKEFSAHFKEWQNKYSPDTIQTLATTVEILSKLKTTFNEKGQEHAKRAMQMNESATRLSQLREKLTSK